MTSQESELPVEQKTGFVTCCYDGKWWVASVLQLDADNNEVRVMFLHLQCS